MQPSAQMIPEQVPSTLTAGHLALLLDKPYGRRLMDVVTRRAWDEFRSMTDAHADLRE